MDEISMDFNKMIEQAADLAMIELLSSLLQTTDDKQILKRFFEIFYKHGVKPDEAIHILMELVDIIPSNPTTQSNEKEND